MSFKIGNVLYKKRRKSGAKKGSKPWNTSKHLPAWVKEKISISHMGKIPWNKGLKGDKRIKDNIGNYSHKGMFRSKEASAKTGLALRGRTLSKETKDKISISVKIAMNKIETKNKHCEARKQYCNTDEHKNKFKNRTSELWKKHPELHPNYKMKNVSKNQSKLFLIITEIFNNYVMLEYPVKTKKSTRFIDVALPEFKLGFEYDGQYWHKEEDKNRDDELLAVGWKIIHIKGE